MQFSNRAPVLDEITLGDVPVRGHVPAGLSGTLYRNGPNPVDPDPAQHWFFGNGMVHAFRLREGRVAYSNRWLQTRFWAQATGRPADGRPDGVANTSIVANGGRLLALEEAHMPVVFDGTSLATLGTEDFGGALPAGPFTAHPKTCPVSGNLVFFGYGADGHFSDTIRLGEVTPAGRMVWQDRIHAPYGAMIHDFAVTARFIAIPLFPLVLDLEQGGFVWKPELGSFLGVIDRARGPGSVRWIKLDGGFAFHVANAWDEGGSSERLTIDLMLSEAPPLFPGPKATPPADTRSFLTRWEVNLADPGACVIQRRLAGGEGEFPRIDERWAGRRNRHVFWSAGHAVYGRDDADGAEQGYTVPDGDGISEGVFVPRGEAEGGVSGHADGAGAGGNGEGDGWLLAVIYRGASRTSDLAILDARDLGAGPVALAELPVRVPDGFHGAWMGAAS